MINATCNVMTGEVSSNVQHVNGDGTNVDRESYNSIVNYTFLIASHEQLPLSD